jgi:hypothetical protein
MVDPELQFVEIAAAGGGDDELLAESRWARLIDRLVGGHRLRVLIVVSAATLSVATFGGTRAGPGFVTSAPAAVSTPSAPARQNTAPDNTAPANIDVCTYEWVYVEDPDQPGVRPYEVLYCPVRPAGHPVRTR